MKRREFFLHSGIAAVALTMQRSAMAATEQVIHLDPALGTDSNPGTREAPMRTLAAAAKRINAIQEPGPTTLILNAGIYALDETAVFKPTRPYSKTERLTIRAAVLPDDPDWNQARMPTLVHTMPLSHDWNGRPDPFDGVAYGIKVETSHVTIQGLRISGMRIIEHPKTRAIHRLYAIGRANQIFDDLEVKQCLFAGDEVTNPLHAGLLVSGTGLVVDHCLFYNVKQGAVYLTPRSTGHAMRNCLTYGSYACAIWISGVAMISITGITLSQTQITCGSGKLSERLRPKWRNSQQDAHLGRRLVDHRRMRRAVARQNVRCHPIPATKCRTACSRVIRSSQVWGPVRP
jgi:hypothetical protein